jgi:hypothetical protein
MPDINSFNCKFPITDAEQSLRQFAMTAEVFNCLEFNNYRDVAVVNNKGQAVPFQIFTPKDTQQRITYYNKLSVYTEPVISNYKTGEQIRRLAALTGINSSFDSKSEWQENNKFYSSIILEQDSQQDALKSITLNISKPDQAISAMLVVEGSDNLQSWVTLLSPYHLMLIPGDTKALNNSKFSLDTNNGFKYLRIAVLCNIENFTQRISSVFGTWEKIQRQSAPIEWLTITETTLVEDKNEWLLELPGLIPVSKIRLSAMNGMVFHKGSISVAPHINPTPPANDEAVRFQGKQKIKSLIKRTIQDRHEERESYDFHWNFLTSFIDYQLQTDDGVILSAPFDIAPTQSHLWKITFDQPEVASRDQLPKIELGWRAPRVVFVAQGQHPFYLLAGKNESTVTPEFPTAFKAMENTAEMVGLLDLVIEKNSSENDNVPQQHETTKDYRIILWIVLFVGVAIMLMMAYQISRSINKDNEASDE